MPIWGPALYDNAARLESRTEFTPKITIFCGKIQLFDPFKPIGLAYPCQ